MRKIKLAMILLVVSSLSACLSIPPLSAGGDRVRRITELRAEKCRFIERVEYADKVHGFGIEHARLVAIGVHTIRNKVAATGGNAFVLHRSETDIWFGGIFYSADAYKCSFGGGSAPY